MTATPMIGFGLILQRSDDGTSSGSFATVGRIHDLALPSMARDAVEVTHHGSTERWREFIPGLKDAGEFSVDIAYDPGDADTTAFLAELNADAAGYYRIVHPDDAATAWGFAAFVTGFEPAAPIDDKMMATASFKLTGKPGFIS